MNDNFILRYKWFFLSFYFILFLWMIIAVYRLLSVLALFPRYRAQTFSVGAVCQRLTADKEPEKVNMTRYKSRAQFPTRVLKTTFRSSTFQETVKNIKHGWRRWLVQYFIQFVRVCLNFKPVLPLIALICIDFVFQILFLSGKRKEVTVSKLLHFCAHLSS